MDKENVCHLDTHTVVLYWVMQKNEIMLFVGKCHGTGDHHVRWNKTDSVKYHMFSHIYNLDF
jgi:hypothetical protein